ncbi:MAG: flavin reductase family protein [Vulcanimicrobiota bacterium]
MNFIRGLPLSFQAGGDLPRCCEADQMLYDFSQLSAQDTYKLVVSTIVPRPIAWVTSLDQRGRLNAAPFSFFNAMSGQPPILVLGIGNREEGGPKDTLRNIQDTGEFVINLVNQELAQAMNVTATPFAPGVNELNEAELESAPCHLVRPPRILKSPVAFECQLVQTVSVCPANTIVIGRALAMHIQDRYLLDPAKHYVDTPELKLVGRMHGAGWYTGTQELFQIKRYTVESWQASRDVQTGN